MAVISCRWDWCRSSFSSVDALETHVKHEHIWPMKPMCKTEIALMRRMDLQSLHSLPDTQSSIFSRGPIATVSPRKETPPVVEPTSIENVIFETLPHLPTRPQIYTPLKSPALPTFEGLVSHSGLSTVIERLEQTPGHRRPSSGLSQEIVEQQLTQEDDTGSRSLSEIHTDGEVVDTELRWPTDDESNMLASEDIQVSEYLVSSRNSGGSPDSTRGQKFRCGSLDVPLSIKNNGGSAQTGSEPHDSAGSQSQPFVLQTQAPYSSQALGWSQTP